MTYCPNCGTPVETSGNHCRHCGALPVLADGGESEPTGQEESGAEDHPPDSDPATTGESEQANSDPGGHSRRAILGYGGGSALLTWVLAGGLWYALVYEQISAEEQVVRDYFNAIGRNNYGTAERLFHSESPDSSWATDEIANLNRVDVSVEDTEVEQRWEEADRESVEEYALVVADVTIDNGEQSETFDIGIMVAQNTDEEWRIWQDSEE